MVVTVCGVQDGWTRVKRKYLEIGKLFVFDFVGFPKRNVIFRGAMYIFVVGVVECLCVCVLYARELICHSLAVSLRCIPIILLLLLLLRHS